MIKNILGGMAIGMANMIPGVSGGTIMVLLGLFDKMIKSISNITKVSNPQRKKDIFFLFQILIGAAVGLVVFANIIDWIFKHYPIQTVFWFIGLIVQSIPFVMKKELKGYKVSWLTIILGILTVLLIVYYNPGEQVIEINAYPQVTLMFLIKLIFIGIIIGGTMILPGVSGSMILLIIGQYYLFKTYVANILTLKLVILIPLFFIGIGIMLGIVLISKSTRYLLENHRRVTVSFILGLIIASAFVLIPKDITYDWMEILTAALAFLFGTVVVLGIEKLDG
ncbi:DUF368 domain-containing protein [Clostridiisalibacter paucivorans]|uniref:DUF368 domain-containing protein n=1 Tax=Clostridiisalibacter paucivorans TaxID=408753 RepID=UPI00047B3F2C|nr:DUF368 domain-containing protein [Clostridiisalibacter paucivorans]